MLIIFEGLDNCGKTTIAGMLKEYYESRDFQVEFTHEFETNIGLEIKKMAEEKKLDSILKSYLFAADRYIRLREYSEEDFNNKIILFDRYFQSAIAYRTAEGIDPDWIKSINSIFRQADIAFYIDITPEESIRRNTDKKFNIIYSEECLKAVRNAYLSILKEYKMIFINGMRPIEKIFCDIVSHIEKYKGNR